MTPPSPALPAGPHGKDPSFVVHEDAPFNGEPPLAWLGRSFVTPISHFFVRNHAAVPEVDAEQYTLRVEGRVRSAKSWTLGELRERFPAVEVTATLQCAGNRRRELMDLREIPGEVRWGCGAIGTAVWRGVRLRDVLEASSPEGGVGHVEFVGLDRIEKGGDTIGYGGSVPLEKAMEPDVLLAWEMNGSPLPPEHGFPLRMVVPGYIGARSVKWLERITLLDESSDNHYQARSYKLFPPDVAAESADWDQVPSLGELALNAVITEPAEGSRLSRDDVSEAGGLEVRGYVVGKGGRPVDRVEVSTDGGRSWTRARMEEGHEPGTWAIWSARVGLPTSDETPGLPGELEVTVRARDSAGNTQPPDAAPLWNFKGYMNNGWHRARVTLE